MPPSERLPRDRWLCLGFLLLALALYAGALGNGFVFDDNLTFRSNGAIRSVTSLRQAFLLGSRSYRPIRTLSFTIRTTLRGRAGAAARAGRYSGVRALGSTASCARTPSSASARPPIA